MKIALSLIRDECYSLTMEYGIHWFRRDLRVAGNLALQKNFHHNKGRVIGIFCFDSEFLARDDFSINRFQFFIETMEALKNELKEIGSDLVVLDALPQNVFKSLTQYFRYRPTMVSFSRDYEPFALKRDDKVAACLKKDGILVETQRDHLLIEPWELSKGDGTPYKVYSAFARKWLELMDEDKYQHRLKLFDKGNFYLEQREQKRVLPFFKCSRLDVLQDHIEDKLELFKSKNQIKVDISIPRSGCLQGLKKLKSYRLSLDSYNESRDFPSREGTSGLSPFLKNGSITVPQMIYTLELDSYKKKKSGKDTFLSELIWREFYYHILYHFSYVEKSSFNPIYDELIWENSEDYFEAWKIGKTGFPIVDAGMRELQKTGFMHNRVRMIVASFLVKDLLVDWRWGERYFMEKLLDGDLAANNGGWQWCASTGCDAQPYFRIFNPWAQSKKFDPKAQYIKKYVPELEDLPAEDIHQPILNHISYPSPIVVHSEQRIKALSLYQRVRGK